MLTGDYIKVSYQYSNEKRDYIEYPLEGEFIYFIASKYIPNNSPAKHLELIGKVEKHIGFKDIFYFGSSFKAKWTTDHFQPYLEAAMKRMPVLGEVGIRKFFSVPESFTPDTNTLLGEVPDFKNFFVCAGLNSIGIGSGGGVGKVTAEWLMNGHINEDLFIYDIKRFQNFKSDIKFIT